MSETLISKRPTFAESILLAKQQQTKQTKIHANKPAKDLISSYHETQESDYILAIQ